MKTYKAPDNSLHFLDDDSYQHLLPAGSVPISDEEADALSPKPDPRAERMAAIDAEIIALETKAHRPTRDALAALATQQVVDVRDAEKIVEITKAIQNLRDERRLL